MVVREHGVLVARVRFPAPRQKNSRKAVFVVRLMLIY